MKPLLEIRDLLVLRGDHPALQLEHLTVQEGEVMGIVGPNGAGKSTLLLAIARLLKPERGEFIFNGLHTASEPNTVYRRRFALVMQEPLLFDSSVFENVASGLKFRGVSKQEIQEKVPMWLNRLGVGHLAKRRAGKLSGGEAQRVSLARAMVLEPRLLLLDEPFSSLDPPTRNRLLDDLGAVLDETRTTTIMVSHDLVEVVKIASQMAIFLESRLQQVGKPEEVFSAPKNAEIADFLMYSPSDILPKVGPI